MINIVTETPAVICQSANEFYCVKNPSETSLSSVMQLSCLNDILAQRTQVIQLVNKRKMCPHYIIEMLAAMDR